jgi:5-methylcytosine-specific restriction endonuclease McrA
MCRTFVPEGLRHIDHIIPLDKGGPHIQENLQLLCYKCNRAKGSKMPEEVTPETWTKATDPAQPFLINPNWR